MKKLLLLCLFTTPIYAKPKYNLDSKNTAQLLCAMDMIEGEQMTEKNKDKIASLFFFDGQATRKNISYCQEWNILKRYSSNDKKKIEAARKDPFYINKKIGLSHIKLVLDFVSNKIESDNKLLWIKNKATNFLTCDAIDVEWAKYVRGYRIVGKTIYLNVASRQKGKNIELWNELKGYCNGIRR